MKRRIVYMYLLHCHTMECNGIEGNGIDWTDCNGIHALHVYCMYSVYVCIYYIWCMCYAIWLSTSSQQHARAQHSFRGRGSWFPSMAYGEALALDTLWYFNGLLWKKIPSNNRQAIIIIHNLYWLVVSTPLKNISQLE